MANTIELGASALEPTAPGSKSRNTVDGLPAVLGVTPTAPDETCWEEAVAGAISASPAAATRTAMSRSAHRGDV
jgi:hypothetical protein